MSQAFLRRKETQAMEINQEQPDKCSNRGRRLAENLHECLSAHTVCKNRFLYGYGYFCSTLVSERNEQPGSELTGIGESSLEQCG